MILPILTLYRKVINRFPSRKVSLLEYRPLKTRHILKSDKISNKLKMKNAWPEVEFFPF